MKLYHRHAIRGRPRGESVNIHIITFGDTEYNFGFTGLQLKKNSKRKERVM